MDELDRILSTERSVTPSPGFAHSVMRAVRHEAATPPAIPFPWRRMMPLIAAPAVLLIAVLLFLPYWPAAEASPIAESPPRGELGQTSAKGGCGFPAPTARREDVRCGF